MLYRYLLTLLIMATAGVVADTATAQTRVHDLLQQRQDEARSKLQQNIDSRGDIIGDRAESQRLQENKSIELSRQHETVLNAVDAAYEKEREKYRNHTRAEKKRGYAAYTAYRTTLINQQRNEMACALAALNQGQDVGACPTPIFDEAKLARDIKNAVNGGEIEAPQGVGTLRPREGGSIRIGGNGQTPPANTTTTSSGNTPNSHTTSPSYGEGGGREGNVQHQLEIR